MLVEAYDVPNKKAMKMQAQQINNFLAGLR